MKCVGISSSSARRQREDQRTADDAPHRSWLTYGTTPPVGGQAAGLIVQRLESQPGLVDGPDGWLHRPSDCREGNLDSRHVPRPVTISIPSWCSRKRTV
jgi:hypothetical protein